MAATTAEDILRTLRDGPSTAQAVGTRLGLDVSSVRRHLDLLARSGHVATEDRPMGRGRPRRHYVLTAAGWEAFARDYGLLLEMLLPRLEEEAGRDRVLAAFSRLALDIAAPVAGQKRPSERLAALERLYQRLGFEATVEETAEGAVLVQRNCPFLRTARADPEACCSSLDQGIVRAALPEAAVSLVQCMATGDNLCRHEIRLPPARTHRRN